MIDVHVIAHTHWDREWYLTREQYRVRLVELIDRVLDRMDREPEFRHFHLDGQAVVLEDYLEVRPEAERRLRRRVAEGRLLVGPWYVMPDLHLVSGEALVRNLALGQRLAESFGAAMRVGYTPDPFGHPAQMPQLLAGFGLEGAILWRGFDGPRAEYRWLAPDGSEALLLHLPREGYCNALWLPALPPERRAAEAARLVAREAARSACEVVLLMAGVDHVEPHPALLELVGELAGLPGVSARLSTLPAYVEAVARRLGGTGSLETVAGELRGGEQYAPLLPGVLSARSYLKQANARLQRLLEARAEPAAAFAWATGLGYPAGELGYAWKTLLQNHPHDSICGCSVDAVHDENVTRFARAGQAAAALEERALEALANAVAPAPGGALRFVAVNTAAQPWQGVLVGDLDVPYAPAEPRGHDPGPLERPLALLPRELRLASVSDAEGRPLPFQVVREEERLLHFMSRWAPPLAVRARRLTLAIRCELPGLSLSAFDASFAAEAPPPCAGAVTAGPGFLENEHLRVEANPDGTLGVFDKDAGRRYERALLLEDVGDRGDEYNHDPPAEPLTVSSDEALAVAVTVAQPGPLLAALEVRLRLPVPRRIAADRRRRSAERVPLDVRFEASLRAGSRRLELCGSVDNRAEDHRLRVSFPTGAERVTSARADAAFALLDRPARRPLPAEVAVEAPVRAAPLHSFVDAGDQRSGITVFADGLAEYELGEGPAPRLSLTLLRAVGWLSRDDLATRRGHAGPGLAAPGAQCPGRFEFALALRPRSAPPAPAALYQEAREFLAPPRLFAAAGREGRLAPRHVFLELASDPPGAAVLSALKRADDRDSLVLRVFNPGAAEARLRVTAGAGGGLRAAHRTDLREQRRERLPLVDGGVELRLGPARIETLELELARR